MSMSLFISRSASSNFTRALPYTLGMVSILAAAFALGAQDRTVYADQYPSVQDAVDACEENVFSTVQLPAETIVLERPIRLKSRVTLQGKEGTVLKCEPAGAFPAIVANGAAKAIGVVRSVSADRMSITVETSESLKVRQLIGVETGKKVDAHINEVDSVEGSVINLHMPVPLTVLPGQKLEAIQPIEYVTLRKLTIEDAQNAFVLSLTRGAMVKDVKIQRSKLNPLTLTSYQVTVEDCALLDSGGGLSFQSCTGAVAERNTILNNHLGGIFFRSCSRGSALFNRVRSKHEYATDGSGDGITLVSSIGTHVRDNEVGPTSCYGMWFSKCADLVIKRNTVTDSFTSGYYVTDCSGTVLQDNMASDIRTAHGFVIERGSGNSLLNNRAVRARVGFVVRDVDSARLVGNGVEACDKSELLAGNRNLVRD